MNYPYMKYSLLFALLFCNILLLNAQQPVTESHNVVTIIGDSIPLNNVEFNTIYESKGVANPQNKSLVGSENGLPSLENEFELHTALQPKLMEANESIAFNNTKEYVKAKKRKTSLAERKFNFKKRFRTWIPKPKKKYRPNICGKI